MLFRSGWAKQAAPAAVRERGREAFAELFRWFEQGKLRPRTYRRLPLENFVEALDLVRNRQVLGKISLTIGDQRD